MVLTHQNIRLPNLIGRLLKTSLRSLYPTIAVVNVLVQIAHVVVLEAQPLLLPVRHAVVFDLETLGVHLGALAQILLRVGEEVVRAGPREVRAADFGVGEGELGGAGCRCAHELLEQLSLFGGHGEEWGVRQ